MLISGLLTLMRFALAVLTLVTSLAAQSGKPNFTGKYEYDEAASQGAGPRQRALSITIEHNEPKLRYLYSAVRSEEYILTTDGSEQVRDQPKGEARMSAKWDGDVLEIRTFRKLPDREITSVERWSLGEGGVLTMDTRENLKSAGADAKPSDRQYKMVFRKK